MIWVMLDWISVFVFGTVLTLSFLGVPRSRRSVAAALWLTAGCLAVQVVHVHFYGFDAVNRAYPLIVHLPLFLTCVFYFKKPPASAIGGDFESEIKTPRKKRTALSIKIGSGRGRDPRRRGILARQPDTLLFNSSAAKSTNFNRKTAISQDADIITA